MRRLTSERGSPGRGGTWRGAPARGSEVGDGAGLCRRDASWSSWNDAQGVGSSWSEGAPASADGVRVDIPVLRG